MLAMPTSAQSLCLADTYQRLPGSSPTSSVPSPGRRPTAAREATRAVSSPRITAAVALPSSVVATTCRSLPDGPRQPYARRQHESPGSPRPTGQVEAPMSDLDDRFDAPHGSSAAGRPAPAPPAADQPTEVVHTAAPGARYDTVVGTPQSYAAEDDPLFDDT